MTSDEFREWLRLHRAAFTGISTWLGRFPVEPSESAPSQSEIMQSWFDTLKSVSLDDARAVTKRMASGDIAEPQSFDAHPRVVCREARDLDYSRRSGGRSASPARYAPGGIQTVRCAICFDTGRVMVAHPESVLLLAKLLRGGCDTNAAKTRYRAAVACRCAAGDIHDTHGSRKKQGKGLVRLGESHHVIDYDLSHDEQRAALLAFVESLNDPRQCENYVSDFESWSN